MLDIACGFGQDGLSLAQTGAAVHFLDVSPVVLAHVEARATALGLDVETTAFDTTADSLPPGPWDLVSCVHYLDRDLLTRIGSVVAPNGRVAVAIATTTNLERHERPSQRFLLDPEELPHLIEQDGTLKVVHFDEAWRANGAHEAWVVAAR